MKVVMTTWDMTGHLNPLVPLGWALRAAGHDVVVISNPGLVPAITAAGLPAYGAGADFDSFAELRTQLARREWKPKAPVDQLVPAADNTERTRRRRLNGFRIAAQSADAQADDALRFAERWKPDLVVFEPAGFLGPLIAAARGIPSVRHLWSIDFTAPIAEFESDIVGDMAARFGLTHLGVNGTVTLSPAPKALQITDSVVREPIRFVPYNGPSVVPSWTHAPGGRPKVVITWGTSQSKLGFDHMILAPRVVEALADDDVDLYVAVTEQQRALFGDLPANVLHLGPVPLHALMPGCDAVVHQGGAGGTMTGLVNALPQVVISHMPDEVFHGRHIEASGAGISLPGVEASVENIRASVRQLLHEKHYRETTSAMRDEMLSSPTPLEVTHRLVELVERGHYPSALRESVFAG